MPKATIWTEEHVNFLETLARPGDLTGRELAARMSRQFRVRITAPQVNSLLQRMRTPSDPFYRDVPYRRRGARFLG